MYKACARCGKIHQSTYICNVNKTKRKYVDTTERKLRSTSKWTDKSKEIRERANYLCEVCRDKGIYNYKDLEVHHITKLSEDSSLLLDNFNLICLCRNCHKKADDGDIDKDYLMRLAKERETK